MSEVWDHSLKKEISEKIVDDIYDNVYYSFYYLLNCHKLGINYNSEEDKILVDELYNLYNDFGFDLTLFFRNLSNINQSTESVSEFTEKAIKYSLNYQLLIQKKRPTVNENSLQTLLDIKNSIY